MKNNYLTCMLLLAVGMIMSCNQSGQPTSASSVQRATVKVNVQADGLTVEQGNVAERLKRDNLPGSVKHLYIISAYSGQVLIYSTVKGKVTSSGKRLTPTTVFGEDNAGSNGGAGIPITIGGRSHYTGEVLQDDGTYGSSAEYLFWFDQAGVYHQHYVSGGQIVHVSDQPINVKSIVINMEISGGDK